ncbi:uncharacterized protein TRAVEDRAFT_40821 [Trametes versicolor FP-101664 SS1]|uniref:Uncharacterized protein n=1 Tax=Trametes versicolor (strain FP-101664) TaxID=717944 RepID=R7S7U9_TRAVS|nr:uncharacterized protein TRAVEDRAFT_40821 [Trametes versicolor FP-101664 SS1]EIW52133.1 hypothetical protein TRAVEDRAFT_40821 [Trametes versicolor FP-101664 SS1]
MHYDVSVSRRWCSVLSVFEHPSTPGPARAHILTCPSQTYAVDAPRYTTSTFPLEQHGFGRRVCAPQACPIRSARGRPTETASAPLTTRCTHVTVVPARSCVGSTLPAR